MHAYLIIGEDPKKEIDKLILSLKTVQIDYQIVKVDDVRELQKNLKLKILAPTAYVITDINKATESAVNAFLKNLEEPQENLYFILTSENENSVLPTIQSRCQIIRSKSSEPTPDDKTTIEFIKMTIPEKLSKIETIKERDAAKVFLSNLIKSLHDLLHKYPTRASILANYIEKSDETLKNIEGNGNVNLQLTNMVLSLV
jgi:DNA polymerase III delta prime subunit